MTRVAARSIDPPAEAPAGRGLDVHLARLAKRWLATWPDHASRLPWLPDVRRDGSGSDPDDSVTRLAAACDLSPFERDVLLVAALPELDERLAELFSELQSSFGLRRPMLSTAARLLLGEDADRMQVRAHLAHSPLWSQCLLQPDDPKLLFFDRVVAPAAGVLSLLEGRLPPRLESGGASSLLDSETLAVQAAELALRDGLTALVAPQARWLAASEGRLVHLRAIDRDAARLVAAGVAGAQQRPLLLISAPRTDADLWLARTAAATHGALLALDLDAGAEPLVFPDSWAPVGGGLVLGGTRSVLRAPKGLPLRTVTLPLPRPREQAALWRRELARHGAQADVTRLAARTRLGVDEIRRAVALAASSASADGRPAAEHTDVARALLEEGPGLRSPLAHVHPPKQRWPELVLERRSKSLLEDLVRRVSLRLVVQDDWGLHDSSGRGDGLVALLHGESGTGKTLAAEAISGRLDLPLVHVDLSRVVSKYIGETEERLAELFDSVEGYRALLFFDEADALFGKRTSVRDGHDHYANIQVNFLLQRLEAFEGMAILATNLLSNMDEAFTRRLQFMVHLPRPSSGLQKRIWHLHLPGDRLAPELDVDRTVARHDLVGGEIKNAALTAAYAAAAGDGRITAELVEEAIRQELVKKGRSVPNP